MWGEAFFNSRKVLPDLFKMIRPVFAGMYVGTISNLPVSCLHAFCFYACKCSVRVSCPVIFGMKYSEIDGKVVWGYDMILFPGRADNWLAGFF